MKRVRGKEPLPTLRIMTRDVSLIRPTPPVPARARARARARGPQKEALPHRSSRPCLRHVPVHAACGTLHGCTLYAACCMRHCSCCKEHAASARRRQRRGRAAVRSTAAASTRPHACAAACVQPDVALRCNVPHLRYAATCCAALQCDGAVLHMLRRLTLRCSVGAALQRLRGVATSHTVCPLRVVVC